MNNLARIARSAFVINNVDRKAGLVGKACSRLDSLLADDFLKFTSQYADYERFLNGAYSHSHALPLYNESRTCLSRSLIEIEKLEESLIDHPHEKRIIYDSIVDGYIDNTILFHRNSSGAVAEVKHLNQVSKTGRRYIDIIINEVGYMGNEPTVCESHFQLLYELCTAVKLIGCHARIFVGSLPFSGYSWPKGDLSTGLAASTETLVGLFTEVDNRDLSIGLPEIIIPIYDKNHSFVDALSSFFHIIKSYRKEKVIAEIDFACISGTFTSLLPRNNGKRRLLLAACSNNRLFTCPSDTAAVICNNHHLTLCRPPTFEKILPYHPIQSNIIKTPLRKDLLYMFDSSPVCIIISNYLSLVVDELLGREDIYADLWQCQILMIGNISGHTRVRFKSKATRVLYYGFSEHLPDLLQEIRNTIGRPFVLCPFSFQGMATGLLLAAKFRIISVFPSINDASPYIKSASSETSLCYTNKLQQLTSATSYDNLEKEIVNKAHMELYEHNKVALDKLSEILGIDQQDKISK